MLIMLRRGMVSSYIYTLSFSHLEKYRVLGTVFYGACHNYGVLCSWVSWVMRSKGMEDLESDYLVDGFMA